MSHISSLNNSININTINYDDFKTITVCANCFIKNPKSFPIIDAIFENHFCHQNFTLNDLFCQDHGEYIRNASEQIEQYDRVEIAMILAIIAGHIESFKKLLKLWLNPFHHMMQYCIITLATREAKKHNQKEILSLLSEVFCFYNHQLNTLMTPKGNTNDQ